MKNIRTLLKGKGVTVGLDGYTTADWTGFLNSYNSRRLTISGSCVIITWHPGARSGKTRESTKAKAFMLKVPEKKSEFAVYSLDKEMLQK